MVPTLPITSFGEHLPNFVQLPEMGVYIRDESSQISFRSPSQTVLEYDWAIARHLGKTPCHYNSELWGSLPLHSGIGRKRV